MISNDYKNYDPTVNTYKVKCGGDLEMWESSGWIKEVDPMDGLCGIADFI